MTIWNSVPGKRQIGRQISKCEISCKIDTERVQSKAEDELDTTKWKSDTTPATAHYGKEPEKKKKTMKKFDRPLSKHKTNTFNRTVDT